MAANPRASAPAFAHAASRARYEQSYDALKSSFAALPPAAFAQQFIDLEAQLDAGMIEVKTAMLTSGLFSSEDEQALGAWIYQQHADLWQLGVVAIGICAREPEIGAERSSRLIALTLLHCGEGVKWELMVGRKATRDYKAVNALMRLAMDNDWQHRRSELVVDGLRRQASIEGLYFRSGLLDRFTSGNLTRQQIEVLDAWLWEWAPAMTGSARFPGGLVLRADLDSDTGLRYGRRDGDGRSLYLALAPLEERRKAVIQELHRGRVVPTQGRASNIRLEAHVAVLIALREMLEGQGSEGLPRAARQDIAGSRMELMIGIGEIAYGLAHGSPAHGKPRRIVGLNDVSATGFRVELSQADAANISGGDLVGLRMHPGEAAVVARVVRRIHDQTATTGHRERQAVQLGLQLLSDPSKHVKLLCLRTKSGVDESFIFVPGPDSSGRFDSFAIPFSVLKADMLYEARIGGDIYTLVFNRVRRRGVGWALAGFEIVGRKREE